MPYPSRSILALSAFALAACASPPPKSAPAVAPAAASAPESVHVGVDDAARALSGDRILAHVRALASDDFQGRAPGTAGEEKTVAYLTDAFRAMGVLPGNPDGTYVQEVPLVGVTPKATASFTIAGKALSVAMPADAVLAPRGAVDETRVDGSELVFCGYGVVAPEYRWDDFKGLDVKGKTLVVLVNDPPVVDERDPSRLDDAAFEGSAMTYYGRYTYKFELGEAKGAAAVLVVHETQAASYPWEVVSASFGRENFVLPSTGGAPKMVQGWLSHEAAVRLFAAAGKDYEKAKAAAARRDFVPIPLGGTAHIDVTSTLRQVRSRNVVGRVAGSDPAVAAEHVIYTAHWDHLGEDASQKPDSIYNGAVDNASGVATMLEIARAFASLRPAPRRSILFLAVTAEEKGLLGSEYYAEHPLYPLANALADLNMDSMNVWGRTRSLQDQSVGRSTLDDLVASEAGAEGRAVRGDEHPEHGGRFRSDHFSFAKRGIPSLNVKSADDYVGKPEGWGAAKTKEAERDYHHPSDEVRSDWDLSGDVEDARLLFRVGVRVAEGVGRPAWKAGGEPPALSGEAPSR